MENIKDRDLTPCPLDEDIDLLSEEDIDKMNLHELAKVIWKGKRVDQRDYKEIVGDALSAHYRGKL